MATRERRHGPADLPHVLGAALGFAYLVLGLSGLASVVGVGAVVAGRPMGTGVHLAQIGLGLLRFVVLRGRAGVRVFGLAVLAAHAVLVTAIAGVLRLPFADRLDLGWPGNAAYLVGVVFGLVLVVHRGHSTEER
ncbi:hypothetical protein LX15_005909 [Streptoalloteichus tenebrarius]|uniref:Integral membrane protein n=1 Tax=Streptoalloteichus tenebrarius (strain ATCC 17920 / DSM 40477 / JCM 4838 / CBS 697.72 / NBRC 16177 / NCIMB 11028 / NRRL B-12390 / A12253. 1 / ISP 5477) TaxID=1933 RepID=A0ABT1I3M8_STRSD|nr:hypothetical protein [Streptoalloteichus tenebrarius]MCP2262175.1 hypothetical protein [Streptoalloteichus tenebrarius]BFF00022.1 hypothetical protein GCM10020241_16970 [Streptoalloteichus tenebrarius]